MLTRVDDERWLPERVQYWRGFPPSEGRGLIGLQISESVFHWDRSRIGPALDESEIRLADLKSKESQRKSMLSGTEFVLYKPPPTPPPAVRIAPPTTLQPGRTLRTWLIVGNIAVILVIVAWVTMRRLRAN